MHQTLLNDAALALSRILTFNRIHHGYFGGFAILAKGGIPYRESKDLDVLVAAPKETIVSILSNKRGWLEIPQNREDYVAFFWKSSEFSEGRDAMVLVEMFVSNVLPSKTNRFPGSKNVVIKGTSMGTSYVPILAEEYLLRGKLNAAAARGKSGDVQDIMWLVNNYHGRDVKAVILGVEKRVLGLAVKRHPELRKVLERYGVQTRGALWAARKQRVEGTYEVPKTWDVQSGLGWVAAC